MIVRIRTKDDLKELLEQGFSGAWRISKNRAEHLKKVEIYNFEGTLCLSGDYSSGKSSWEKDANGNERLTVAFENAKIEKANYKWVGQNPISYVEEVNEAGETFNYRIDVIGMSAELVIGTISEDMVEKWQNGLKDELEDDTDALLEILNEGDFKEWQDYEDVLQINAPFYSEEAHLRVVRLDEEQEEIAGEDTIIEIEDISQLVCIEYFLSDEAGEEAKPVVLFCQKNEGSAGVYHLALNIPFDPKLLGVIVKETSVGNFATNFFYDGEKLYNEGDEDSFSDEFIAEIGYLETYSYQNESESTYVAEAKRVWEEEYK